MGCVTAALELAEELLWFGTWADPMVHSYFLAMLQDLQDVTEAFRV